MEAAIEPKVVKVPIHPQERFLVNIVGILRRSQQVRGQPQHGLIVQTHELLKGGLIAFLRRAYERRFVHPDDRLGHGRS